MSFLLLNINNNVVHRAITSTAAFKITFRSGQKFNAHSSRLSTNNNNNYALCTRKCCRNLTTTTVLNAKEPTCKENRFLKLHNINPNFIAMEYAVRGPIVIRAGEIEKELKAGAKKPFKYVIRANIGDCHAMGQKPITFLRQLLMLTFNPNLLNSSEYPDDIKTRAKIILESCRNGSVGSYTESPGLEVVRRQVADFITERDGGIPSNWENIFLTNGATPGIKSIISLMNSKVDGKSSGIMVPIPQYPLFSATISEYGMEKIPYYLDEEHDWGLNLEELERSYDEAKRTCNPRAIVVINPGNPTGQVLTKANIMEIIKFAYDNKLVIMADEVYQENVYDENSEFFSFKMVINEMGAPYKDMELVSFNSASKGYLGECGIRGGYMEIVNMCPKVLPMLAKQITASLCSNTAGQVAVSALVNPPQCGEPSYDQYIAERCGVLKSLSERAELIYNTLSKLKGFELKRIQGSMFVFPKITIPHKAIEFAKSKNVEPDKLYCFELLETSGICVIAGSGFGQKPGTYHFRTTILPQAEVLKDMMNRFETFHEHFIKKYS